MLNKIKAFFASEDASTKTGGHAQEELHIAAAGLLIEAAMTDGNLEDLERNRIAVLIEEKFGISKSDVDEVMKSGEERAEKAVDIYSFLRVINEHFDHEERIRLVEMLWDVAYADDVLHDHEANLVGRVSSMLGLTDRENGEARKRVLAQRGS